MWKRRGSAFVFILLSIFMSVWCMLTHTQDNILTHFYMSLLVAIQQRKWKDLPNVHLLNPHWFEPHSSFNSDDFSISSRIFEERSFVIQPKLAKWLNEKIQNDKKLNEKKPSIKTTTPTHNGNIQKYCEMNIHFTVLKFRFSFEIHLLVWFLSLRVFDSFVLCMVGCEKVFGEMLLTRKKGIWK